MSALYIWCTRNAAEMHWNWLAIIRSRYDKIKFNTNMHNINVRRKYQILYPRHKTWAYEKSLSYDHARLYNYLTAYCIVNSSNKFKNCMRNCWFLFRWASYWIVYCLLYYYYFVYNELYYLVVHIIVGLIFTPDRPHSCFSSIESSIYLFIFLACYNAKSCLTE